jgi:hypothetical protein
MRKGMMAVASLSVGGDVRLDGWSVQLPVKNIHTGSIWMVDASKAVNENRFVDAKSLKILDSNIGSKYIHRNDDSIVLYCAADGHKTPNAKYARTELRQGNSDQGWTFSDSGSHGLEVKMSILAVPSENRKVVVGQILANKRKAPLVVVQWDNESLYVSFREAGWKKMKRDKFRAVYLLNSEIAFKITVDGKMVTVADGFDAFSYHYGSSEFGDDHFYFKTGVYLQTATIPSDYAKLSIQRLRLNSRL